jgi:hypothetical protein
LSREEESSPQRHREHRERKGRYSKEKKKAKRFHAKAPRSKDAKRSGEEALSCFFSCLFVDKFLSGASCLTPQAAFEK